MLTVIVLVLSSIVASNALIEFECGGRHLNVTSISLLDFGECNSDIKETNSTEAYIQLLQLSDYNYAEVIQCKAEITRTVKHCGMHSHTSEVHNGFVSYLEPIVSDVCDQMHKIGIWRAGISNVITGIRGNDTITRPISLGGTIRADGKCEGITYSDNYGVWDNVVVQGFAKITLRSGYVPVHLTSGKIILKSGTTCELKDGHCIDSEDGYTFWKPMPTSACDFHQYDVLYEGKAMKTQDVNSSQPSPLVFSLNSDDITFALATTAQVPMCSYALLKTEHPRLFIMETTRNNVPKKRGDTPVENLDIFTYVNSKFVYVENHIRTQMTSLYHNVIQSRCQLEREVITNTLSLATLLPDEFAFRIMKKPGYMALVAGEAVHIIQCIPVEVTVRRAQECYVELPIHLRNLSFFLTPKSRIIAIHGTQRECTQELPTLYRIEDTWIEFAPAPRIREVPPQQLQPMTKINWRYLTPESLAVSGIYSKADIDKLRNHIMFPVEKPAVLNAIARGMTGYQTKSSATSFYNMLDEDSINKLAESAASKVWGGFVTFGSATAGVLGVFIIIRIVKLLIDTAINGYALHTAYGCSLHLLSAIWSSMAHLLLHLAHRPPRNQGSPPSAPETPEAVIVEQPRASIPDDNVQPKNENTGGNAKISMTYKELSNRLNETEQIPPNTSGVCF